MYLLKDLYQEYAENTQEKGTDLLEINGQKLQKASG